LAAWGGIYDVNDPNADINTIFFLFFKNRTWLLVIIVVLSVTMSTSACDTYQNALVDSVGSTFVRPYFKGANLMCWIRALTVVLNVPIVVISLQVRARAIQHLSSKLILLVTDLLFQLVYL
jgi:hypothetical protein